MANNMPMFMDHATYWVADVDGTSNFLSDILGFRRHPIEIGCSDDDPTTGGMVGVFFDGNGLWIELILPTTPGPGMDILDKVGPGALVEVNFEPTDYDATLREMKARGITLENMDGSPIGDDGGYIKEGVGKGDDIEHTGQRIAYWPKELSCGSTVEIYERIRGDDTGLLNRRDIMWADEPRAAADAPWISHIVFYVKDLETATRFYTDVIGLSLYDNNNDAAADTTRGAFKTVFIDAGGVWLQLVQPLGPGAIMDTLQAKGDGYMGDTAVCIADMAAFVANMKAKGVTLLGADGRPIDDQSFAQAPQGDKIAYFPADVSCGMVVMVFERGSEASRFPPRSHPPKAL